MTLLLAALWRPGDASTAMDRLFQSALQPTATTGARLPAPVAPTATVRGDRAAPTATPAARVLKAAYLRRLPLVLKGWPPTPTPNPTPGPYGWKGAGYPGNQSFDLGQSWQCLGQPPPSPTPTPPPPAEVPEPATWLPARLHLRRMGPGVASAC